MKNTSFLVIIVIFICVHLIENTTAVSAEVILPKTNGEMHKHLEPLQAFDKIQRSNLFPPRNKN